MTESHKERPGSFGPRGLKVLAIVSLAFPVYYTVLSLVLHARRSRQVVAA